MPDVSAVPQQQRVLLSTRRFDSYVASSAYAVVGFAQCGWPLITFARSSADYPIWRVLATSVAAVALMVLEVAMVRWSLQVVRTGGSGHGRRRLQRWWAAVAPLLALTLLAPGWEPKQLQWPSVFAISVATAWAAVSLAYPLRVALAGGLIIAALGGVQAVLITGIAAELALPAVLTAVPAFGLFIGLWVAVVIVGTWSSGWMLRVFMEVNRAGRLAAELAIAEERLRISRDLHDVFGRTLATVAVKSELAESLARRGRIEQSADEMAAVRSLADETGREIRGVIRGYREADLGRELVGAQALLDSAGISCEVCGRPPALSRSRTAALAWVLREAVTNVIRHSQATAVSIRFAADPLSMIIENDGVTELKDPSTAGHGLVNMAERLSEVGGSLDHQRDGAAFRVIATLPADGRALQ